MEIKKIKHLKKKHAKLYEAGLKATEQRNLKYAIDMFRQVLHEEPGVLEIREKLRAVEMQRIGGNAGPVRKLVAQLMSIPIMAKGTTLVSERRFHDALDNAEKAMAMDPTNPKFRDLLTAAADAAGMPMITRQVLESANKFSPNEPAIVEGLARTYLVLGKGEEAIAALEQLAKIDKANSTKHKNAGEQTTAQLRADNRDPYDVPEGDGDARKKAKESIPDDRESIEKQIRLLQRTAESANTADNRRRLGELFAALGDFDQALENYYMVMELTSGADTAADYGISDAVARKYNRLISDCQGRLKQPKLSPEEKGEITAQLQQFQQEKWEQLIERARGRCLRSPHSTKCALELASALWQSGNVEEAINTLQGFKSSSQMKEVVLFFLGRYYFDMAQYKTAIDLLKAVIDLLPRMNRMKKEACYHLARSHEKAGNKDDANACFKELYGYDENYRDVGAIVDKLYHEEQVRAI